MSNSTKLYVVTVEDLQGGGITSHYAVITTEAPRTNQSGEVRVKGWLGTNNNVDYNSHGSYTDLDAARAKLRALGYIPLSEAHEDNQYRFEQRSPSSEEIAEYWLPQSAWLVDADAYDWLAALTVEDRKDGETLDEWAERLEDEAEAEGVRIVGQLEGLLENLIDESV
jgi:hypothetical protein